MRKWVFGHKVRFGSQADIRSRDLHVRFVPKADELHCCNRPLFDHLVGAANTQRLKFIRSDRNSSRHASPKSPRISMVFLLIISRNSRHRRARPVREVFGLDLPIRGHRGLTKLGSFSNFEPTASTPPCTGCVFNQSTRAAAVASMPVLLHQTDSSLQRCTSR